MKNKQPVKIEIIGERKAKIFQGEFYWGEIEIPENSWNDLAIGLKGIALIPETEINLDPNDPIPVPEPAPIPEPVPPPVPPKVCTGPFCPGGTPFRSLQDLRDHIADPLINPGKPGYNRFILMDENIIEIKSDLINKMLK